MKYRLDASELFYYNNSIVSLVKKPSCVSRYVIYDSIDPMRIIKFTGKLYNFQEGQYLEVDLKQEVNRKRWDNADRVFFQFVDGSFVERKFPLIPSMEGEHEFGHHLGFYRAKKL